MCPVKVERGDARLSVPRPRLIPFSLSSSICFSNAAGGRCAQVSRELFSFLPSFSWPPCCSAAPTLVHLVGLSLPSQSIPTASQRVEGCGLPGHSGRARSCPRVERQAPGKRAGKTGREGAGSVATCLRLLRWAVSCPVHCVCSQETCQVSTFSEAV